MTRPLVTLLLVALPLAAAPVPKAAKKQDDATAILGRWQGTTLPNRGDGQRFDYTFRFGEDGTCGITNAGAPQEIPAGYTLDPSGSPKRMKWLNGPEKTEWRCVYELDGNTLRIGFVPPGKEIPDNLELKNGLTVYELKRATDDK